MTLHDTAHIYKYIYAYVQPYGGKVPHAFELVALIYIFFLLQTFFLHCVVTLQTLTCSCAEHPDVIVRSVWLLFS